MARVNIEIDLRNKQAFDRDLEIPVQVVYHWNRIFFVGLLTLVIIGAIYLTLSKSVSAEIQNDTTDTQQKTSREELNTEDRITVITAPLQVEEISSHLTPADVVTVISDEIKPTDKITVVPDEIKPTDKITVVPDEIKPTDNITVVPDEIKPTDNITVVANEIKPTDKITVLPDEIKPTDTITVVPDEIKATDTITVVPDEIKATDVVTIIPKSVNHTVKIYDDSIVRALITSDVFDKEPVDELQSPIVFDDHNASRKVYFFTQRDDRKGGFIRHQWWHNGKVYVDRSSKILGKRWRFYTSKHLNYKMEGLWQVKAIDETGKVLAEASFFFDLK